MASVANEIRRNIWYTTFQENAYRIDCCDIVQYRYVRGVRTPYLSQHWTERQSILVEMHCHAQNLLLAETQIKHED